MQENEPYQDPPQEETDTPPLQELTEDQEVLATIWLDKVFKMLVPKRVYERATHTNYDKYIRNYLLEHEIAIAREGTSIAVIREGKVFAVWKAPNT